jgi:4-diphosphocytidyl-2-C-methyl-D-erythritol kinase
VTVSSTRRAAIDAPAKINLFLRVLAREESGYHQIETLFCALELVDTIEIERGGGGIALDVAGADLGDPRGNLVYRAADAFFAAAALPPRARIRLRKRIPHGAGLGGGSSDAAATLRLLDAMHGAPLGAAGLLRIAATLGADVPFFAAGRPLALAWGRGERMLALPPAPRREVLLLVPDEPMATPQAYAELARRRGRAAAATPPVLLDPGQFGDWAALARLARNDFEAVAFDALGRLREAKALLGARGATPALLSGSGSALFGVFADAAAADAAAAAASATFPAWRCIRTATAAGDAGAVDPDRGAG